MPNNQLIAGNWKMNGTLDESISRVEDLLKQVKDIKNVDILICPPYHLLHPLSVVVKNTNIKLGAQDCHFNEKGAFTGSISANMLKDIGCSHVIVGHSERRLQNGETNEIVKQKATAAIACNLVAILCIGETKEEKEAGKTLQTIENQLVKGLPNNFNSNNLVVAYEPMWAIGTGLIPTLAEIENTHNEIKKIIAKIYSTEDANKVKVLYGGSLNAKNCNEILPLNNVDGGLIGGASLINTDFTTIISNAKKSN